MTVEEIAADPAIGFAILTTPPNARAEILGKLAAAGRPILMEKPVERTLGRGQRASWNSARARACPSASCSSTGRGRWWQSCVGSWRILGPMVAAEVSVPWWRPQAYYDEPGRGTYARDGGGVLISQAIHTLDLMLSLTGPVVSVNAMVATTGFHRMEAEDFVCAGLRFASAPSASFSRRRRASPGGARRSRCTSGAGPCGSRPGCCGSTGRTGRARSSGEAASTGVGGGPDGLHL
jgi:UDP-N-acetyl-2-amino-2-deoxyglucuronate dehydrogenase